MDDQRTLEQKVKDMAERFVALEEKLHKRIVALEEKLHPKAEPPAAEEVQHQRGRRSTT